MQITHHTQRVAFALAMILSSFGFLCSDVGVNTVETKPGEKVEVLLKEGKSITLEPDNFVLEFSSVEQDSRCPDDVVCVWQGEAEIMLTLLIQRGRMRRNVTIPGLVQTPYRGETVEMGLYRVRLLQLDPYPHDGGNNGSPEYVALLEIEKIQ